jgi:hypothetical protein
MRFCGEPTVWNLRDMLEINGQAFMRAVQEMNRVRVIMDQEENASFTALAINEEIRPRILADVAGMVVAIEQLHARAALISAGRLQVNLQTNTAFTWGALSAAMADIDSRLNDELGLVKLFVMDPQQTVYLQPGHLLVGDMVAARFPSIVFEVEEAARCLALGRATASAFHSMRALEIAVRALASFLGIPDPLRPVEKNWGIVLSKIKAEMDAKYPATARMPGKEGAEVEALYVSLDAMKNPWRNATMHTENTYQPHEANHILQCLNVFMLKIAAVCDEAGNPV